MNQLDYMNRQAQGIRTEDISNCLLDIFLSESTGGQMDLICHVPRIQLNLSMMRF